MVNINFKRVYKKNKNIYLNKIYAGTIENESQNQDIINFLNNIDNEYSFGSKFLVERKERVIEILKDKKLVIPIIQNFRDYINLDETKKKYILNVNSDEDLKQKRFILTNILTYIISSTNDYVNNLLNNFFEQNVKKIIDRVDLLYIFNITNLIKYINTNDENKKFIYNKDDVSVDDDSIQKFAKEILQDGNIKEILKNRQNLMNDLIFYQNIGKVEDHAPGA